MIIKVRLGYYRAAILVLFCEGDTSLGLREFVKDFDSKIKESYRLKNTDFLNTAKIFFFHEKTNKTVLVDTLKNSVLSQEYEVVDYNFHNVEEYVHLYQFYYKLDSLETPYKKEPNYIFSITSTSAEIKHTLLKLYKHTYFSKNSKLNTLEEVRICSKFLENALMILQAPKLPKEHLLHIISYSKNFLETIAMVCMAITNPNAFMDSDFTGLTKKDYAAAIMAFDFILPRFLVIEADSPENMLLPTVVDIHLVKHALKALVKFKDDTKVAIPMSLAYEAILMQKQNPKVLDLLTRVRMLPKKNGKFFPLVNNMPPHIEYLTTLANTVLKNECEKHNIH